MAISLGRSQECYVVPESVYGVQEGSRPVGTDQIPIIRLTTPPNPPLLTPVDKTGTRTRRQPIVGGNIEGAVEFEAHLIPSGTPNTPPDLHDVIKNLLGATYTINTTVASAVSGTVFDVASATNIAAGTILLIGNEARPVASVASVTVTMAVPFSSTPSGSATVKGINYKPADPVVEGLDVCNYDGQANLNRVALGVVFGQCTFNIDTAGQILSISASGLARSVVANAVSKPTGVVVGTPIASSFGAAYIGTALQNLHGCSISLNNGDTRRQVPAGSQYTDGISRGVREVTISFEVYLDGVTKDLYTDALARTPKSIFIQIGNTAGKIWAFWLPTLILQVPEPDFGEGDVTMRFDGAFAYGTGNNELFVAHC